LDRFDDAELETTGGGAEKDEHLSDSALVRYLGNTIRDLRLKHHLAIADIAQRTEISHGMLSKIENGQTSASLDSLSRIARALGVSMSSLFRQYDIPEGSAQLVKSGEGMEVVRRGTKRGHTYHLLAYGSGPTKLFEPFLITMNDEAEIFPTFEHPGTEFIYMLEGKLEYRHGARTYLLEAGDSFTFRGDIPHGPERLLELPIRFLTAMVYPTAADSY
jgi:transcriptional regulator with XRE-family HTH domain